MCTNDQAGDLILEVSRARPGDRSPLQLISAELLAYYRRRDAELAALLAATATRSP